MNILGRWVIFVDVTRGEFERNEQKRGAKNTERSGRGNFLPPLFSFEERMATSVAAHCIIQVLLE